MPTSARLEVANSPQITVKNGAICRVDVGIDPYTETGSACVCAAVKVRYIFPSTFCLEKRIG